MLSVKPRFLPPVQKPEYCTILLQDLLLTECFRHNPALRRAFFIVMLRS